jgi:hypothetical protein
MDALANTIRPPPLSAQSRPIGRQKSVYGVAYEPWIVGFSILVALQGSYVALGLTLKVSATFVESPSLPSPESAAILRRPTAQK